MEKTLEEQISLGSCGIMDAIVFPLTAIDRGRPRDRSWAARWAPTRADSAVRCSPADIEIAGQCRLGWRASLVLVDGTAVRRGRNG
jgi:hypothetical protein